jgi:hypothetical protein
VDAVELHGLVLLPLEGGGVSPKKEEESKNMGRFENNNK